MVAFLFADLSWGGYTPGATRWYLVSEEDVDPYYALDSVTAVYSWDGSGSRCSFSSPVERANYTSHTYSYDPQTDTAFAYYDGTYLVDYVHHWILFLPGFTGIRVLKFPLTLWDYWQATDTCVYPLYRKVSIGYDEDWDGIEDSMYFSPSYADLTYLSGDTAEIFISPYLVTYAYTSTSPDTGGSTFLCCFETHLELYLHIKYVRYIGMVYYSIDTLIAYRTYAIVDTSTTPWDTTYVPPTRVGTYINYLRWEYTTTGIVERRGPTPSTIYLLKGRVLRAERRLEIYSADGRLVGKVGEGGSITLKPGIYFIVSGKERDKVVVR